MPPIPALKGIRKPEVTTLSPKARLFAYEYVVDFNGPRAAEAAGYSTKNVSVAVSKLLADPRVRAIVDKMSAKVAEKCEIKSEDVLRELLWCVQRDVGDLVNADGSAITNLKLLPENLRRCIDGVEQTITEHTSEDGETTRTIINKFKLVPKATAIDMAMKHLGAYAAQKVEGNITHKVDWDGLLDRPANPTNVVSLPNLEGVIQGEDPQKRALRKAKEKHPDAFPSSNGNGHAKLEYSTDELGEPSE